MKISYELENNKIFQQAEDEVHRQINHFENQIALLAITMKEIVEQKCNQTFGAAKMAHFNVIFNMDPFPSIEVKPLDEVGEYIYYGTSPHIIMGDGMPIGEDRFASVVHHPGTEGISDEIDSILVESFVEALLVVGAVMG